MLVDTAYRPVKVAPGADRPDLVSFMRAIVSNPVSAIPLAAYREPIALLSMAGATFACVSDPDLVEEVLIKRMSNFPKSDIDERVLRPILGDGLITAHGDSWRWKRRLAAPCFTPAALERLVPDMVAPFQDVVEAWRRDDTAEPRDVNRAMAETSFKVISRALFSNRRDFNFTAISTAITDYLAPISWVMALASLKIPPWVPHPGRGQIRRARQRLRQLVGDIVADRRQSSGAEDDICTDLMRAHDPETGRLLDDEDLIDMLLTLGAAGYETTANALTWALMCLAEQPELQEEMAAEVDRIVGNRPIEAGDLGALGTVEAFIEETLRLLPPVALLSRRATHAHTLGGHDLKAGTALFIPIYAIHRHERLWRDPDRFDLSRFQGEARKQIPRTAYMPFGVGPRVCIGGTFAMMEMVAGIATLLRGCRFAAVEGARCEPVHRITLRPKGGLPLYVTPRAAQGF